MKTWCKLLLNSKYAIKVGLPFSELLNRYMVLNLVVDGDVTINLHKPFE